jgi:hypothetical protein
MSKLPHGLSTAKIGQGMIVRRIVTTFFENRANKTKYEQGAE